MKNAMKLFFVSIAVLFIGGFIASASMAIPSEEVIQAGTIKTGSFLSQYGILIGIGILFLAVLVILYIKGPGSPEK